MNNIKKEAVEKLGYDFIPKEYLPAGQNEYYLRNRENPGCIDYRNITALEKEILIANGNTSTDWEKIFVL